MRKAFMIMLALAAIRVAMAAANTSKAYNAEARTASLETRVGNLEQAKFPNVQTGTAIYHVQSGNTASGQPAGTPTSGPHGNLTSTSSAYPTGQTSGQQGSGTSHYHDYGGHWHDMGNHTHDFMGHYHPIT